MANNRLPKIPLAKSRSVNEREDESIYRVAPLSPGQCSVAPVVRTYNIAPNPNAGGAMPPSPSGGQLPKMHADSSQIQGIFNPVQGPRDVAIRQGIKPLDHAKSNIKAIKEQSSLNRMRKMSEQDGENSKGIAGARLQPGAVFSIPPSPGSRSTSAPSRRPSSGDNHGRNFVMENRMGAAAPVRPPRAAPKGDDGMKYLKKKDFGRVPTYLLERKIETLERQEDEIRAKEAALVPPGMRMLSEQERLETLAVLQKNRADVETACQRLPLRIETPGQIRRRDELEQRMREIEEGIKVFSRPKVLVKY